MAIPFFYLSTYQAGEKIIQLNEDTSRHIAQVLRMEPGEDILLTDGKGAKLSAKIIEAHKKKSHVELLEAEHIPCPHHHRFLPA